MFVSFALLDEGGGVGVEVEGRDELPPGVGVGDRWLGGGESAGYLANFDGRQVFAVGCGAVTGVAVHMDSTLRRALFTHVNDGGIRSVLPVDVGATGFADAVCPRERVGVVLREPFGAQPAPRFLVGDRHEVQRSEVPALARHLARDHGHGCGDKQHVNSAATVYFPVFDHSFERWLGPMLFIDGHHIGVRQECERFGLLGVGAGNGDHQGYSSRFRLKALDADPEGVGEEFGEGVGVADLLAAAGGEVVDAGVLDQGYEQLQGVVVERVVRGDVGGGHETH